MRIGILSQWYEPEPGPAALPSTLARTLVSRGHEVQVLTGYPNYPSGRVFDGYQIRRRTDEILDGVAVRRVALVPSHDHSVIKRALNYGSFAASAWASGIEVLSQMDALWVNYSPVTIGAPMLRLQRRHRVPVVMHVLDLWPDTVTASGLGGRHASRFEAPLHRWCTALYRSADKVAYISPSVGRVLGLRGVPPDKLAYAPMWADESVHQFKPAPLERGWDLSGDTVTLVYAGTLGGAQDLSTLVRACADLKTLNFRCLIAGSGTEEGALKQLAENLGAHNVTFLGRLAGQAMTQLASAADLQYVGLNDHPLARITMPSKIQAILASGRPIVGSLVGDASEVVTRSGGWTSRPGDVPGLVENLRSAVALGRAGLRKCQQRARDLYDEEFSLSRGVDRIEGLLQEAAARRRRA